MFTRARTALGLTAVAALAAAALPAVTGAAPASAATTPTPASILAGMSLAQRVGQLFMVGAPVTGGNATANEISAYHVGNVMLTGRSYAGTGAVAGLTSSLQARVSPAATAGVPLFVATDQEGGRVQVLHGPGFSAIPSALTQGSWSPAGVRASAHTWGNQLRSAGVNVDLGPVVDTVPSPAAARTNPPIGALSREFGYTPAAVAAHGTAFAQGLADAGVAASVKHFPGLGRVNANTDVSTGVTDWTTVRHDAYLAPFASAIDAGSPFVMMSTAYYHRIDASRPAAFSPTVINTVLRGDLHFGGVVISDDLANARQVAAWSPGARAVDFIAAGGDMVLTVNPATLPAMYNAVLSRASQDSWFRSRVEASALRILTAKTRIGGVHNTYARYAGTTLRQGSAGVAVIAMQAGIGGLAIDGGFGPMTRARVIAWQQAHRLPADGVFNADDWRTLAAA